MAQGTTNSSSQEIFDGNTLPRDDDLLEEVIEQGTVQDEQKDLQTDLKDLFEQMILNQRIIISHLEYQDDLIITGEDLICK